MGKGKKPIKGVPSCRKEIQTIGTQSCWDRPQPLEHSTHFSEVRRWNVPQPTPINGSSIASMWIHICKLIFSFLLSFLSFVCFHKAMNFYSSNMFQLHFFFSLVCTHQVPGETTVSAQSWSSCLHFHLDHTWHCTLAQIPPTEHFSLPLKQGITLYHTKAQCFLFVQT